LNKYIRIAEKISLIKVFNKSNKTYTNKILDHLKLFKKIMMNY